MARKIFIAATARNSGKTTTSLALMHMAAKKYQRVGFIKPIGPKPLEYDGGWYDKDALVIARIFGLTEDLPLMSPFVVQAGDTKRVIDGELSREEISQRIFSAIDTLAEKNDFLVIEGAGHTGVGSIFGCNNARIASQTGATVLLVTGGGLGNVVDFTTTNLAIFKQEQARVKAILVNKIIAEKREQTLSYLTRAFAGEDIEVIGGFNYQPTLANPTMRRIANVLNVRLHANEEQAQRIVHHLQMGAASAQRVVELLRDSTLVVVNRSRDELLVTISHLYQLPEYKDRIAGIIIPGMGEVGHITQKIIENSGIPWMRAGRTSTDVFEIIREDVSKIVAEDSHKLDLITDLTDKHFNFDEIDALLD